MQHRKLVRQPGNGIAFAAAGRVLDEVMLAGALLAGIGDQAANGI